MSNAEIARMLHEYAQMMDLQGDVFKRNAYRRAARSVEELDRDIRQFHREGRLETIPGVGKAIAAKITEMLETGRSTGLEDLRRRYPPGAVALTRVPDIGPRKARKLYEELGITDLEGLRKATQEHRVMTVPGFGKRSEENILRSLAMMEGHQGRMSLGHALPLADGLVSYLQRKGVGKACVAGSLRRGKETVGDIDLVASWERPEEAIDAFISHPAVTAVVSRGDTRSTVRLADGTQVDLRVVPPESYGAALQYFTGSKEHNVELRRIAGRQGCRLNEYGLFHSDGTVVAGAQEDDIYRSLGLEPIPPELRENRGEIEAAARHQLPDLVRAEDIRGDLHVHTVMSDGRATMREIAQEAKRRGYEYIGVSDHSMSLRIAHGLSIDDLLASVKEAWQLTQEVGIPVLRGAEVDILADGSLDYPQDVLSQLDYVIGSVHTHLKMGREEMTDRVMVALANPELDILGHPTGRLIGRRNPYSVDMDEVMSEASRRGVALEVNGFPDRLDLNDVNCRKAREHGVKVCLGTDAHGLEQLDHIRYALVTARRGWLERGDVLNALPLVDLRKAFGE
jgi:DNA polymerase (family X)